MRAKKSLIKVHFLQVDFLRFGLVEFLDNHYKTEVDLTRMYMSKTSAVADREKIKNLHGFAGLAKEILKQLNKPETSGA